MPQCEMNHSTAPCDLSTMALHLRWRDRFLAKWRPKQDAVELRQETAVTSAAFERFRFSFFEDQNSVRDGLNTTALTQLAGDEITQAEDLLIACLPDSRAVIGLGILRTHRAEPQLTTLFDVEQRQVRETKAAGDDFAPTDGLVDLAKALWRIRPDPRWRDAMTSALLTGSEWTWRMSAALALVDVCDPVVAAALVKALDDDDSLVRYHAARGLLTIHGLPSESKNSEHMTFRLMSKDSARREGGKRDILIAITGRPICTH